MKVAAITITYNRLELTKACLESFYAKTKVDYHLIIDNGSSDGTVDWVKTRFDHIPLDKNYGIAMAFQHAVSKINGYDYILKLDNDIEVMTDGIIEKMVAFLDHNPGYAVSPVDLLLDPGFKPAVLSRKVIDGHNVELTSHTGGAFQLARTDIVKRLCDEFNHLAKGDYMIGHYYRRHGVKPAYLTDLQIKHVGIDKSCQNYKL